MSAAKPANPKKPVKRTIRDIGKSSPKKSADPVPVPCGCCPDCVGKASGTMGACEDGACYDIPPPTNGTPPFVLVLHPSANSGLPFWEEWDTLAAALANREPAGKRVTKKSTSRRKRR